MNTRLNAFSFKRPANAIEWKLLVFLVLFMDVKLVVKLVAICLIYIMQPNFRFGFRLKVSRLPLFYPCVIAIAVFNWAIYQNFSANYSVVFITALLFWATCILAIHQLKLIVESTSTEILHNTLRWFFILNIAMAVFNLSTIFWEIGFQNPFRYQGEYQKYFVNTGDHIKGISFDSSTTNALINSFGAVYFLYRKQYLLLIACMSVLILTASNFTNVILLLVFVVVFLFRSIRDQKTMIAISAMMLIVFLAKFSPQNDNYVEELFKRYVLKNPVDRKETQKLIPIRERPDSLLDNNSKKEKLAVLYLDSLERERQAADKNEVILATITPPERPVIPGDSIHTPTFQSKKDTTAFQHQLFAFAAIHKISPQNFAKGEPGKLIAFNELFNFMKHETGKMFTGNGAANFSSKLAFRATGLQMAGGFPHQFIYSHPDFLNNHFNVYKYFFTKTAGSHSLVHSPASVYGQVMGEYGVLGIVSLLVFYFGFFLRRLRSLSYGIPLLGLLAAAFFVDYWFEQLSIVALFELMMFIDIKENTKTVSA